MSAFEKRDPDKTNNEKRTYFYRLESLGILKMDRVRSEDKYKYKWELTQKGRDKINSDDKLKILWKDGDIKELYELLK